MFTVYVLKSKSTDKIYIGQTADKENRLKRHNKELFYNQRGFTAKNKGPWKIAYEETFNTRSEAIGREKFLKSHVGRDYIRSVINSAGV